MDSEFHAMDCGFQVLESSLCQWNLDYRFLNSLSCFLTTKPRILDFTSKIFPDSGFHKQKFHDSLSCGYNYLVFEYLIILTSCFDDTFYLLLHRTILIVRLLRSTSFSSNCLFNSFWRLQDSVIGVIYSKNNALTLLWNKREIKILRIRRGAECKSAFLQHCKLGMFEQNQVWYDRGGVSTLLTFGLHFLLACAAEETKLWLSRSAKQRRNPW